MSEPEPFSAAFLDDYFAECDEHLATVRRDLLALESSIGEAALDRERLESLFRAFHSIKGLSGMVGLQEAERLAHVLESYLRALRRGEAVLTQAGMDAAVAATRTLEQVIGAFRERAPIPEVAPAISRLEEILPAAAPPPSQPPPAPQRLSGVPGGFPELPEREREKLLAALQSGGCAYWVEFRPSPALAERGINVNAVRARLREAGEIVHAAPRVDAEGAISFEFLVVGPIGEAQVAEWERDGLSCRPYPLPEAPAAAEARPAPPSAAPPPPTLSLAPSNVVRVDLARLDELMRLVGELVIDRSRLEDELRRVERALPTGAWRSLQEIQSTMARHLRDLREAVMRVRMVPIGEVFDRMRFVVRDLARDTGKQVRLELSGPETEIDKYIVERMMDPLLHLVRNAVSHGLETPQERVAQGKPAEGTIRLSASTVGDLVAIAVEDDGRGIDLEEVAARAQAQGLLPEGASVGLHNLLDILCAPGFSTRLDADVASGRGVGMAVGRTTVQDLGGTLSVETWPGRGTRFFIHLPLTLAIVDALLVRVGGQTYAVPQPSVREIIEVRPEEVRRVGEDEIASYRGGPLPLFRLARFFRLEESSPEASYALVVGSGPGTVGLVVDRVLSKREIVVHALSDPLVRVPGIAGATDLGDGRAVLILDVGALARWRHTDWAESRPAQRRTEDDR